MRYYREGYFKELVAGMPLNEQQRTFSASSYVDKAEHAHPLHNGDYPPNLGITIPIIGLC